MNEKQIIHTFMPKSKLYSNKEKDYIERVVYNNKPQNMHTTAKVITKRTNTRTRQTAKFTKANDDKFRLY